MRYAMLICADEERLAATDRATGEPARKQVLGWFERWGAAGKLADGGAELDSVRTARTVRAGADGAPVVSDGPYLEHAEVVGGVVFLDAGDLDEAVAIASTWPGLPWGTSVEVRPVVAR